MKTIYGVFFCLLVLMTGCKERSISPTTNRPASTWSDDSLVMRQQFKGWVQKLFRMNREKGIATVGKLITDETGHPDRQKRLFALAEEVFNDPNSPLRNENLYIPILEAFVGDTLISEAEKMRPWYQLAQVKKNRPGSMATDFSFLTVQGKRMRLYEVESEYTLLYFFNPDCRDCERVAHYLLSSKVFGNLQNQGLLKVVAVYPNEELGAWEKYRHQVPVAWITGRYASEADRQAYYLPAIPVLYLLDKDKRVILKDAPVEYVEQGFMRKE